MTDLVGLIIGSAFRVVGSVLEQDQEVYVPVQEATRVTDVPEDYEFNDWDIDDPTLVEAFRQREPERFAEMVADRNAKRGCWSEEDEDIIEELNSVSAPPEAPETRTAGSDSDDWEDDDENEYTESSSPSLVVFSCDYCGCLVNIAKGTHCDGCGASLTKKSERMN